MTAYLLTSISDDAKTGVFLAALGVLGVKCGCVGDVHEWRRIEVIGLHVTYSPVNVNEIILVKCWWKGLKEGKGVMMMVVCLNLLFIYLWL